MSSAFASLDIARTGLGFHKFWMDTVAHNVANANTMANPEEEPFRARMVVAVALDPASSPTGGGVAVADVLEQEGDPALVYDPENPLADEGGYVAAPVVDLAGQLSDMILASRTYQANLTLHREARTMLETATSIGRG